MNLPTDFIKKYQRLLGDEAEPFLASFDQPSIAGYRVNPLKTGSLADPSLGLAEKRVEYTANGYLGQINGKALDHVSGYVYSQEPSAMYVGEVVDPQPNERVLDLCAAPGGKSTSLIAHMRNQGVLISNEIFAKRASVLSENIERWGAMNTVVTNESPDRLAPHFQHYFDKILVDAPCSGEGMFRKDPASIEYWNHDYPSECANRQRKILKSAMEMLKPGGTLVYSTCTFAPEEDEQIAAWLVDHYPDLELAPIKKFPGMDSGVPDWADGNSDLTKTVRLFPHHIQGEGHFIAKFISVEPSNSVTTKPGKYTKMTKNEISLLNDFMRQTGLKLTLDHLVKFGDHLYRLPNELPAMNQLKFVRPGLQLGTFKKKRFEPSYSLALAIKPTDLTAVIDISESDWRHVVHGETISIDEQLPKGWYLLTCKGHSVTFGKLVDQTIKNFYPKGLRM